MCERYDARHWALELVSRDLVNERRIPIRPADLPVRSTNTVVLALLAAILDLEQRRVIANVRHPLKPARSA
jgi:hypothetical protein